MNCQSSTARNQCQAPMEAVLRTQRTSAGSYDPEKTFALPAGTGPRESGCPLENIYFELISEGWYLYGRQSLLGIGLEVEMVAGASQTISICTEAIVAQDGHERTAAGAVQNLSGPGIRS